jgi:NADH-quinone oxidoreductase subunit G
MLGIEEDEDPLAALENGSVKALVLTESDPSWSYPDQARLIRALDKLELLVVMDYLPSVAASRAQVFFPSVTVFEKEFSHYVNQEGRLQRAVPLHQGGTPILQVSGGSHPPREFQPHIPGGDSRPSSEILTALGDTLAGWQGTFTTADIWNWLSHEHALFQPLAPHPPVGEPAGWRLLPEEAPVAAFSEPPATKAADPPAGHLELLLVDQTFGTEELASYSPVIRKVEEKPCLTLHQDIAAELGLISGDQVAINLPDGVVTVTLKTARTMAAQVAILPRHRQLQWQKWGGWPTWIPQTSIKKA